MANYPSSLDSLTNPTSSNTLDNPSHSLQHSNANDILEALETKVGIGASPAGSATSGHALVASTGGTTSWTTIGTAGISSGTASSGQILTADGTGGVSFSNGGLVLINTTNFSAVASQSLNNVFSANYRNYRIIVDYVPATTSGVVSLRMRASGSDNSTSNYQRTVIYLGASSPAQSRNSNTTEWVLLGSAGGDYYSIAFDLFTPFASLNTHASVLAEYRATSTSANEINIFNLGFNDTTSFDGISLLSSGSNLTGAIRVYGYND